jgi:riboflavin kinase/FMN adenylyltransferase
MKQAVVAIGNFDGVHVGHQMLLSHARALAVKHDLDFTVLTFSPHPRSVFQPNVAPFRISCGHVKQNLFDTIIQPDNLVTLDFDAKLRAKTADEFIDDILIQQCNAAFVIVGQNFHFGFERAGNIKTLNQRTEFKTVAADLFDVDGDVVSSTRIREHLKNAEMKQANALLGWDWVIQSEVIHGDKRGREIGYPTANMHFGDTLVPSHGVYAVQVQIEGSNEWLNGAANIGIRPMFETAMPMLETYIFDFEGDLYGKQLKIKPVQKLRDEMKFDGLDALVTQIDKDCDIAKNILHNI